MAKLRKPLLAAAVSVADTASWSCALALLLLLLVSSLREDSRTTTTTTIGAVVARGAPLTSRRCDEIYVVGEGETLHTIAARCGDPFILEQNPHIQDHDDVYPGLVLKLTPSMPR